jgi:hypothetical protein
MSDTARDLAESLVKQFENKGMFNFAELRSAITQAIQQALDEQAAEIKKKDNLIQRLINTDKLEKEAIWQYRLKVGQDPNLPHNDFSKWSNPEWIKEQIEGWARERRNWNERFAEQAAEVVALRNAIQQDAEHEMQKANKSNEIYWEIATDCEEDAREKYIETEYTDWKVFVYPKTLEALTQPNPRAAQIMAVVEAAVEIVQDDIQRAGGVEYLINKIEHGSSWMVEDMIPLVKAVEALKGGN